MRNLLRAGDRGPLLLGLPERVTLISDEVSLKKKVLLYNPKSEFYAMPLGLLAVGSALDPDEFEVVIVDGRILPHAHRKILDQVDSALCLGITVFTGSPIRDALRLASSVKSRNPRLPIIWGGWHPSILPEQCLRSGMVDFVVPGQGEATFAELVSRLNRDEKSAGCPGCLTIEEGRILNHGPRAFQNVNTFRAADYTLLDVEMYFKKKGHRQLDFSSSRGCPYQCTFCADPQVYGGRWSGLKPRRVLDELLQWHRMYQLDEIFFLDDDLFANHKRLSEICRLLIQEEPGFGWKGTARADELCRLSEEALENIRRSGCRRINVGAESGSQVLLDRIKKKYQVERLLEAGERCSRHNIRLTFSFIAGFPGEPETALDETVSVIQRLKKINPDFNTPIYFYAPYPGTELAQELEQAGWKPKDCLEEWFRFDIRKERYPWTTAGYVRKVRNLNFYLQKAYTGSARPDLLRNALGRMARWRLNRNLMAWPLERQAVNLLRVHK